MIKGVLCVRQLIFVAIFMVASLPYYAQELDWYHLDENEAQFGFIGYQGARKNTAIDGAGNSITCAPFGIKVVVENQTLSANFETLIVKRNGQGQVVWSRTLNGSGFKFGHSIHADSVGNIYVLGWYYGNSSINGVNLYSYGNYDCFLVKLNAAGTILYSKTFGSAGYDYPFAISTDTKGNVWVAGKFSFSLQLGALTATGGANSHFLFKLSANGNAEYLRNVCQDGSSDWGRGDLSRSNQGKLALVSNFIGNSSFQNHTLNGGGGYLALIDESTGNIDSVFHAGGEAWLVDHETGGSCIVLGLQKNNSDSLGNRLLPSMNVANQVFLGRVLVDGNCSRIQVLPKLNGGAYQNSEGFRTLHVSGAGQVFISGELEGPIRTSTNFPVSLNLPHASGKPQAILIKLDDDLQGQWFAGVGSRDTIAQPNKNIGSGVHTDATGNIIWSTMNDAYSVTASTIVLNNDTFNSASVSSRYGAHGIHTWKLSEPSIKTFSPNTQAYCPGDSVHVAYLKFGNYAINNAFILELSDSTGAFQSPVYIESNFDTSAGTIHGRIPLWLPKSDYYRFRVRSTFPAIKGSITERPSIVRGKPMASAGSDFLFCLGDTLSLLATGGGAYLWDSLPNSWQFNQAQLISVPDTHMRFVVKVTDSVSTCFNYDTAFGFYRTKVNLLPIKDTAICRGSMLNLVAGISAGDSSRVSYNWRELGGGLLSDKDTLGFLGDREIQVELIAWDSCSVFRDTLHFRVLLRDSLQLHAVSDTVVCAGSPFKLQGLASGGDSLGYRFYWMDSSFSTPLQLGSLFDTSLTKSSKIGLKLMDGCSALSDSLVFSVAIPDKPKVSIADSLLICSGEVGRIHAGYVGGFNDSLLFSWNGGNFGSSDSFEQVFTQSEYVKIEFRDQCQFSDFDSLLVKVRTPLSLQVRSDSLICMGESLLLYVEGAEKDSAYYSFFWEGNLDSGNYLLRTPLQTERFPLRIRDNCTGLAKWDTVVVSVRDPLKIDIQIDTPACYGQQVLLNPSFTGGLSSNYSIQWLDENGDLLSNAASYQVEIRDKKSLSVVLRDACTVQFDSLFIALKSGPALTIEPLNDTVMCYGQVLRLAPILSGGKGGGYSVLAFPYDSASLYSGFEPNASTKETLLLSDGCSDTVQVSFYITIEPPLSLTMIKDTSVCEGEELVLKPIGNGGLPNNYSFSFQQKAGIQFPLVLQPLDDTVFVVCLMDGCSRPICDSQSVTVHDLPNAAFAMSDTLVCIPEWVSFTSLFPSNNASRYWSLLGVFSDSLGDDESFQLNFLENGSYQVGLRVVDSNACSMNSQLRSIEAKAPPNAKFLVSDSVVDVGSSIELLQLDRSIVYSAWSPASIQKTSPFNYTFKSDDTGWVALTLTAENIWGCSDTYTQNIRFKNPFLCYIPNAFNPAGHIDNQVFIPQCEHAGYFTLMIYDRWGALVFESNDQEKAWDGTWRGEGDIALPSGVYFYLLKMKNEYNERYETNGIVHLLR